MLFKEVLLREIKRRGIKNIFGVPGRENEKILFSEIDGINFVTTRVEFTAGVAADMSGRLNYEPQVAFSTMGPGATNMTTAVASAMLNKSPVIFFTAQLESNDNFYNVTHQCVDQKSIFEPITKWSYEISNPNELPEVIDKAFDLVMTEPVGPVHIAIPTDFFCKEITIDYDVNVPVIHNVVTPKGKSTEHEMKEIYNLLKASDKPICLLGQEIRRGNAVDEVLSFCHNWQIPFITAANMKGISNIHEDPLNYGSASCYMEGIIHYPALEKMFADTDVIVLIGYQYVDDLLPKMWDYGEQKQIILINASEDPIIDSIVKPEVSNYGSIKDFFKTFNNYASFTKDSKKLEDLKEIYSSFNGKTDQQDSSSLNPVEIMHVINKHVGDGFLLTDIGYYRHHAILFSEPKTVGRFFSDTGLSSFGSGLPSAIAAKINNRDKNVFLICGDGGFHSGSGDLATLVKYDLPIVIILLNNSSFELINLYQSKNKNESNSHIVSLSNVDFVKLAEANGCYGKQVKSIGELENTLTAYDKSKPLLIEIPLEYTDNFEISF
ncbi:thiamine pyrophosphate-binding protein [Priestia megaterium]|uniref:thiamine pyrophosphate-binding protein n=1 Tax=Priestia megaterium TaxID=1404 RepID=UPI00300B8486